MGGRKEQWHNTALWACVEAAAGIQWTPCVCVLKCERVFSVESPRINSSLWKHHTTGTRRSRSWRFLPCSRGCFVPRYFMWNLTSCFDASLWAHDMLITIILNYGPIWSVIIAWWINLKRLKLFYIKLDTYDNLNTVFGESENGKNNQTVWICGLTNSHLKSCEAPCDYVVQDHPWPTIPDNELQYGLKFISCLFKAFLHLQNVCWPLELSLDKTLCLNMAWLHLCFDDLSVILGSSYWMFWESTVSSFFSAVGRGERDCSATSTDKTLFLLLWTIHWRLLSTHIIVS